MNTRAYCSRFNFTGADPQKKVSQLSGGERNRVHLARMLKEGANVLLLDEPTNDLDVNTLCALEDALERFAGCAVVRSHDRWFLDRIATHILAFEGESKVTFSDGTARVGGRRARRGLTSVGHRQRWHGWVAPIASTTRGRRSRNFTEYEEWRTQQRGEAATRPHRIAYRKLTR